MENRTSAACFWVGIITITVGVLATAFMIVHTIGVNNDLLYDGPKLAIWPTLLPAIGGSLFGLLLVGIGEIIAQLDRLNLKQRVSANEIKKRELS